MYWRTPMKTKTQATERDRKQRVFTLAGLLMSAMGVAGLLRMSSGLATTESIGVFTSGVACGVGIVLLTMSLKD